MDFSYRQPLFTCTLLIYCLRAIYEKLLIKSRHGCLFIQPSFPPFKARKPLPSRVIRAPLTPRACLHSSEKAQKNNASSAGWYDFIWFSCKETYFGVRFVIRRFHGHFQHWSDFNFVICNSILSQTAKELIPSHLSTQLSTVALDKEAQFSSYFVILQSDKIFQKNNCKTRVKEISYYINVFRVLWTRYIEHLLKGVNGVKKGLRRTDWFILSILSQFTPCIFFVMVVNIVEKSTFFFKTLFLQNMSIILKFEDSGFFFLVHLISFIKIIAYSPSHVIYVRKTILRRHYRRLIYLKLLIVNSRILWCIS